jgi:RNA polymerase sigma-70 factor (ECF subfamily)
MVRVFRFRRGLPIVMSRTTTAQAHRFGHFLDEYPNRGHFVQCFFSKAKIHKNYEQDRGRRNIYTEGSRQMHSPDPISGISFANTVETASSPVQSEIEREVLSLFDEFRAPLLRYALSFGVQMHDAEEVVQETFLSLFRHLQLGKSKRNLRGWIFRVTHNLALKDRYAKRRTYCLPGYDGTTAEGQIDPQPNPEQLASIAQRRVRLLALIEVLPETDQRIVFLRAEGLGYREIASVLGISLGSVSISLTRTLARLARAEGR